MTIKKRVRMLTEHGSDGTHSGFITLATSDIPLAALPVSTQSVVTGSRAIGTIYQNTTGKPMFVAMQGQGSIANAVYIATTDSNATPTTVVTQSVVPTGGWNSAELFFIVLPDNYYKVTLSTGTPTLSYWTEWY